MIGNLLLFGLIGFWVYWSIKHEGIYWIPKAFLCFGSFGLFLFGVFKLSTLLPDNLFVSLILVIGYVAVTIIVGCVVYVLLEAIDETIKERMGKDPYQ